MYVIYFNKIDKRLKAETDMRTQLSLTRADINIAYKINVKFTFLILDFRSYFSMELRDQFEKTMKSKNQESSYHYCL